MHFPNPGVELLQRLSQRVVQGVYGTVPFGYGVCLPPIHEEFHDGLGEQPAVHVSSDDGSEGLGLKGCPVRPHHLAGQDFKGTVGGFVRIALVFLLFYLRQDLAHNGIAFFSARFYFLQHAGHGAPSGLIRQ